MTYAQERAELINSALGRVFENKLEIFELDNSQIWYVISVMESKIRDLEEKNKRLFFEKANLAAGIDMEACK